jgi:hypothetical protein
MLETPTREKGRAGGPSWRRLAELAAVLVLLYFVAAYLLRHWHEIRAYPWEIAPRPLLAATLLAGLSLVLSGWIWTAVVRSMGERVDFRHGMPVWFVSALARYVPGKLWQISGMMYLSRRQGINALHALGANFLMQILVVAIGAFAFVATLPAQVAAVGGPWAGVAVAAVAALLVVLYLSPAFEHVYARVLSRLGQPPPATRFTIPQKLLFGLATAVMWLLWGASFWLFLDATTRRAPPLGVAIGICAAGYVGGFLAFISPGGLGVRESLYAVLLGPYVPASVALAVALLNRVWLTLIEVALALVSSLLAGGRSLLLGAGRGASVPRDV